MKRKAIWGVMRALTFLLEGSLFGWMAVLVVAGSGFGQSKAPQFETVSIRAVDPRTGGTFGNDLLIYPGGMYRDPFGRVIDLIALAYDVKDAAVTVVGHPKWVEQIAYNIVARPGPEYAVSSAEENKENVKAMLRSMLADRFQLRIHPEVRQTKVLALHVKEGGAKLQPASAPVPPENEGRVGLGLSDRRIVITATKGTTAQLASVLTLYLPEPVVDKTGLTGVFDIDERWEATPREGDPVPSFRLGPAGLAQLVSILDQNLGLVLRPDAAPIHFLVIDHVDMPTEN